MEFIDSRILLAVLLVGDRSLKRTLGLRICSIYSTLNVTNRLMDEWNYLRDNIKMKTK